MDCTLEQLQEYGMEMLRCVVDICECFEIPYVMAYGSLLGTIRHKGPIPWDYDIDIMVPMNEIDRFVQVMSDQLPEKYWIHFRNPSMPLGCIPRIGLKGFDTTVFHIDIFPMCGLPNNKTAAWFQRYARFFVRARRAKIIDYSGRQKWVSMAVKAMTCFLSPDWFALQFEKCCRKYPFETAERICYLGEMLSHEKKEVFDSVLAPYDTFFVRIPKKYDSMLRTQYGEYMKYPPEEQIKKAMSGVYHVMPLNSDKEKTDIND